jgi:hypothetical protein
LVEEENKRWLVAPYGAVDWVKNARVSGMVKLSRGKRSEDLVIRELPLEEAAPVLKKYLKKYPITKPYFDARVDSALDEFVEEARSRPVFELIKINPGTGQVAEILQRARAGSDCIPNFAITLDERRNIDADRSPDFSFNSANCCAPERSSNGLWSNSAEST